MIADEQEYRVTQAAAHDFEDALARLETDARDRPPEIRRLLREALASQLADLHGELAEYRALVSGQVDQVIVRLDDGTVVDLITGDVIRPDGLRPHLARQPLRVLAALVAGQGAPVSGTTLEERHRVLAPKRVIGLLRQAIGDDGTRQYYIQTVHPLGGELSWRLAHYSLETVERPRSDRVVSGTH